MADIFEITQVADKLKAEDGHATTVFTVTSTASRALRGVAKIKPLGNTEAQWIKIEGHSERDFPPGGTHQFTVNFDKTPSAALSKAAQSFPFRLDVISAANPDEDFTEGPTVTVEVPGQGDSEKNGFPWWILIAIALFLVIASIVAYLLLRPSPSPTPQRVAAVIYENPNFGGKEQELFEGRYDDANAGISIGNDSLSSLKVPPGLTVRLYEHFHFQGAYIDITADTPAVSPTWNDATSSIIVYKTGDPQPAIEEVVIFEHSEYNASNNWIGAFQVLEKRRYDGIARPLTIGNDTLSSALVPNGMVLRLYEHASFQGSFIELKGDTPAIPLAWNDRVSSIVVYASNENVP